MALVLAEGIAGKAPKLKSKVEKMKMDGWDWLGKLIKNKTEEGTVSIKPLDKYLRDLIGGDRCLHIRCEKVASACGTGGHAIPDLLPQGFIPQRCIFWRVPCCRHPDEDRTPG